MTAKRPHGNTYWVEPGLLAGEYPGAANGDASTTKLRRYLDACIDCFIDLTGSGELEPYEDRLYAEASACGKQVEYRRFPINDRGVPESPDHMREILVEGSRRARVIAQATMERVRDAMKLRY